MAAGPDAALRQQELFSPDELIALADMMAAVIATADLAGRARVREQWTLASKRRSQFAERSIPDRVLPPERALEFFRRLQPTIGVDPMRWGELMQRRAFTLAVDTEGVVLEKIQSLIADRLATGRGISATPTEIDEILDAAGISSRNPQYAEMVFRTNYMDASTAAVDEEKADPEVSEMFPVWRYSNPSDSRSRPSHAARNGRYYPASMPFAVVRGTDVGDVVNCRCDQVLIERGEWEELRRRGARLSG